MKKITFFLFVLLSFYFVSVGQRLGGGVIGQGQCNLSVSIDSIIVKPCFLKGGGVCGCGNTLWAVVSGGTAPYSYVWSPSGITTDTLLGACYLLFSVVVTDANGCTANASLNVIMPPTGSAGITEFNTTSEINLYPVPAVNELKINITDASLKAHAIEIYDMLGNKVIEQQVNTNVMLVTLDVSTLTEGNYFLRIVGANGQKTSRFSKVQ